MMKKHVPRSVWMCSFFAVKRNIFTLIELLIVVAVIAILAALLLPALNKAKEKAVNIQCLNQQKQLGTFFQMYTQEYNGYFPGQLGSGYATCWAYILYQGGVPEFSSAAKMKNWMCPVVYSLAKGPGWNISYALADARGRNGVMADGYGRMTEIKVPSTWLWISEAFRGDWKAVCCTINGLESRSSVGTFAMFHGNRGNITFYDGHSASYGPQEARNSNVIVPFFFTETARYYPITDVFKMFTTQIYVLLKP